MTKKKIGSLIRPDDLRQLAEEIAREKAPQLSENLDKLSPQEQRQLLYELRVHQVELEMQNESLRQTQEELESSQLRYFNLYDQAPGGYFTQNKDGLILEANLKAGSLLGVARKTLNEGYNKKAKSKKRSSTIGGAVLGTVAIVAVVLVALSGD